MASTSEIKKGVCMNWNNDVFTVVEFLHVKPGKGAAFVRTKLKSVTTGKVLENNFPAGANIELVRVERRKFGFLYEDETGFNFMDQETFDQISAPAYLIDNAGLLKEGTEVEIQTEAATQKILGIIMPATVVLQITSSEQGVRGDTSNNPTKRAVVETGYELQVPLFVNEGEKIRISTETGLYQERVK